MGEVPGGSLHSPYRDADNLVYHDGVSHSPFNVSLFESQSLMEARIARLMCLYSKVKVLRLRLLLYFPQEAFKRTNMSGKLIDGSYM